MNEIKHGDSLEVLEQLEPNSVHAVITDPPYGLAFMGRDWDDFEPKEYQEWCQEWAEKAKQVLKPGGHLLAFSGNRTHHRLFTGVEDAGFEIRDTLTWHYGSGFPKASDISKTIDKRSDQEREIVGVSEGASTSGTNAYDAGNRSGEFQSEYQDTIPKTKQAKEWDGWKTGLKPATEFIVMARKPYEGATVDSVLENGTGALNIDATRIKHNGDDLSGGGPESWDKMQDGYKRPHMTEDVDRLKEREEAKVEKAEEEGRYPANVVFDETAADGDAPSRYFYTSKASRSERTDDGAIENDHPTVKPVDRMEWLVRLVTREDQVVLDPFAGSGTTAVAAKDLGREFVAIERQAKYVSLAQARIGIDVDDPSVVREADAAGLDDFA